MNTGRSWSMGDAAATAGAAGPSTGTACRLEQSTPPRSRRRRRTFQGLRAGRKQRKPAVGTHYGPTWRHQAGYSPHHPRDDGSDEYGPQLEHGRRRCNRRGRRTVNGNCVPAGAEYTAAEPPAPQDLPGTTGRQEAAEAYADSTEAALPC